MHRSGTSLISRILHMAGVNMGDILVGASPYNKTGYYEDVDFIQMHKHILLAQSFDESGHEKPVEEILNFNEATIASARLLLDRKNKQGEPWGWKDPRTCLMLDLYRQIATDAIYVIALRPAKDIVRSLVLREKFDPLLARFSPIAKLAPTAFLQRKVQRKYNSYYLSICETYLNAIESHKLKVPSSNLIVVHTENIISDSVKMLDKLSSKGFTLNALNDISGLYNPALFRMGPPLKYVSNELEDKANSTISRIYNLMG